MTLSDARVQHPEDQYETVKYETVVVRTCSASSTPSTKGTVRGELLDAVMEAVVQARGSAGRAAVIAELVEEMCTTAESLHGYRADLDESRGEELAGIRLLSRAARDHRRKMTAAARLTPGTVRAART